MKYAWLAGFLVVSMVSARGSADEEAATPADDPANTFLFTTNSFTVKAGTERFLCHAITLKEDLVVDRYSFPGAPYVHHLVLARTVAPEPEGMSECDILFRTTWLPEFVAGTGESNINAPAGTGYHFKAGDQIVLQLHLLNAETTDVTTSVTIKMRKAKTDKKIKTESCTVLIIIKKRWFKKKC